MLTIGIYKVAKRQYSVRGTVNAASNSCSCSAKYYSKLENAVFLSLSGVQKKAEYTHYPSYCYPNIFGKRSVSASGL